MTKNLANFFIFVLLFGLLAVFLVHNFDSIGQDVGRHLRIGEIIWQTKEVPKINLFSFTEPDFPFVNHHWLSEVIFYGVYNSVGFTGLILLKIFVVIVTFLLLFFTAKHLWITDIGSRLSTGFWPIAISFLLSIFIFISRTEVRPEIFSFLILAFFLFALFKAKYGESHQAQISQNTNKTENTNLEKYKQKSPHFYLWFLPLAQLFWVNLHIYFFIGPLIFLFFLVDKIVSKKVKPKSEILNLKKFENFGFRTWNLFHALNFEFRIFGLILLATFINPAGIKGALLPLNILKEYGYSIVENQTLAFLSGFFGFDLSVFVFKFSVALLVVCFVLKIKKIRQRVFEILMLTFFTYAGFKMFRNLPLYAIASFPLSTILLTDVTNRLTTSGVQRTSNVKKRVANIFKIATAAFLVLTIFFIASGGYYRKTSSSKKVGFSVPNGLERAVNFVKENKIDGPMFNNFDTGGYLVWKLYPDYKVFVDNRPEAYSVKFFDETYKPMQKDSQKWTEFSDKYNINFIFFAYSDATPWGETFLGDIVKNSDWRIVYINEVAIILVKNNKNNKEIISDFSILETNAIDKTVDNIKDSNSNKIHLNIDLSLLFYKINWREAAIYFADEAIKLDPQTPRPYLFKGFVYARSNDLGGQKLAGENIKKAIELGLKESQYYYILGVVYMNLGRLDEAKMLFKKALELDKNNMQAKEFLQKYF